MSAEAKRLLKEKKRRERRGVPEKEPEIGKQGLWMFVIVALIVVGCVVAWIVGAFGR